jgi:phytanoyl-CoA hydroxylase
LREAVTLQEVDFYRQNGFLVLPDLLDGEEVKTWREAVIRALAERTGIFPKDDNEYAPFFSEVHEYHDKVFSQTINLWMTSPAVRDLVLDQRLGRIAATLADVDGVRIYLDQVLIKEPFANPTAFHLDVPYWSFKASNALTIWVALSDATIENGCLCYVPKTHLDERYDNVQIDKDIGALFDVYPAWKDIDPVFCPVPAGGAVVHNGLTAHGAGANMTPRQRIAMAIAYMPDGARFNGAQDVYTKEQVARMRIGDLLENEDQNPLVFSAASMHPSL